MKDPGMTTKIVIVDFRIPVSFLFASIQDTGIEYTVTWLGYVSIFCHLHKRCMVLHGQLGNIRNFYSWNFNIPSVGA